jgi:hypothetical protein
LHSVHLVFPNLEIIQSQDLNNASWSFWQFVQRFASCEDLLRKAVMWQWLPVLRLFHAHARAGSSVRSMPIPAFTTVLLEAIGEAVGTCLAV